MDSHHDLPILLDSDHIKFLKVKYPRQSKMVKGLEDECKTREIPISGKRAKS